jgi:hypothetical protein
VSVSPDFDPVSNNISYYICTFPSKVRSEISFCFRSILLDGDGTMSIEGVLQNAKNMSVIFDAHFSKIYDRFRNNNLKDPKDGLKGRENYFQTEVK